MLRQAFLGTALAAILCAGVGVPAAAAPTAEVPLGSEPAVASLIPLLRDQVTIAGPQILLGDVFANMGDAAERPVMAAPAPGERVVFDADRLAAIAGANGVAWAPRSRFDRATVTRESRTVDSREMERRIGEALARENGRRDYEIEIEGRPGSLHLPVDAEAPIEVENLRVDERDRRATATLVAPTGDGGSSRLQVTVRLHPVVDVPVLRAAVMPGQAIAATDLEWSSVRADRLRRDAVTDPTWLIGMTPRRSILPGAPVSSRDVQERLIVSKNSMVTIVLRSGALMLTARGKALDDGAEGAAIRVLNPRSERVIEATVVGPDTVEIRTMIFGAIEAPHRSAALSASLSAAPSIGSAR